MKIAIAGCAGRMGQVLIKKTLASSGVSLSGGSVREGSKMIGLEVGSLVQIPTPNARLTSDPEELFASADAVIDFTTPDYSQLLASIAAKQGKILICGTTALNLILGLVEKVASILSAEECDIEIDEMHHRFKVDSPSGTALTLGAAAARGRGVQLADVKTDYQQTTLGARKQGAIGFSVRRGGDVIGDHTVTFASSGECIELAHKSSSRDIYANGAIRAAIWAKDKPAGFYSMKDVLGI